MNYELNKRIQAETRSWIDLRKWHDPYAFTFTLKQSLAPNSLDPTSKVRITRDIASSNFSQFLHRLNRDIFKNQVKRRGCRLTVFPVREGSETKFLHYHGIFDKPTIVTDEDFRTKIRHNWNLTPWGAPQIDIQSSADNGWVSYITKFGDKDTITDSIDLNNVHLPI